jgi:hypothetical protein
MARTQVQVLSQGESNPGINSMARDQSQKSTQWPGIKSRNYQWEKYLGVIDSRQGSNPGISTMGRDRTQVTSQGGIHAGKDRDDIQKSNPGICTMARYQSRNHHREIL